MVHVSSQISPSSDPLSEPARKERTLLIGLSFVGLLVSQLHILPTKIAVLGIDFNAEDQRVFVLVLTGVLIYSLLAFLLYASSDYVRFTRARNIAILEVLADNMQRRIGFEKSFDPADLDPKNQLLNDLFNAVDAREKKLSQLERPLGVFRVSIEFSFPVLLAIISILLLLTRAA